MVLKYSVDHVTKVNIIQYENGEYCMTTFLKVSEAPDFGPINGYIKKCFNLNTIT